MAQVAEFVRKTSDPPVDIPAAARIHIGRCDSPGAIRRAAKRITQALLDGKLDRETHNGAQYGLGLMLKAVDAEREEAERERERARLAGGGNLPAPKFHISFEDGGPGGYGDVEETDKEGRRVVRVGDDPNEAARIYQDIIQDRLPQNTHIVWERSKQDGRQPIPAEVVDGLRSYFGDEDKLTEFMTRMQWAPQSPNGTSPATGPLSADAVEYFKLVDMEPPPASAIDPTPEPTPWPQPIAAPEPAPAVLERLAPPPPKPKPPAIEPVKTLEPTAADVLGPVFETTEAAAERALHKALARSRVAEMMKDAEAMRAHVESTNERERREFAAREANMAKEKW
jgi:hypothetical protein